MGKKKNLFHKAVLTCLCNKPSNEETSPDIYTVKMPERLLGEKRLRQMLSPAEIEICKLLLHSHKNAALKIPQSKICSTESDKKKLFKSCSRCNTVSLLTSHSQQQVRGLAMLHLYATSC